MEVLSGGHPQHGPGAHGPGHQFPPPQQAPIAAPMAHGSQHQQMQQQLANQLVQQHMVAMQRPPIQAPAGQHGLFAPGGQPVEAGGGNPLKRPVGTTGAIAPPPPAKRQKTEQGAGSVDGKLSAAKKVSGRIRSFRANAYGFIVSDVLPGRIWFHHN